MAKRKPKPAETAEQRADRFILRVLDAARAHGEDSDPEHEVGDLQHLAFTLWRFMTLDQKKSVENDEDLNDLIVQWIDT